MDSNAPRWSSDVHQADWIAPRLAPWEDEYPITMVVPAGFEAYARVLHPAETPDEGGRLVRWAEVAAWSGMPLRQDAQFHSVALPPTAPGGPPPYSGGPREGSLYAPDAEVLAEIGRDWTGTPDDCWFCVWDGFGWDSASALVAFTETGRPPGAAETSQPAEFPETGRPPEAAETAQPAEFTETGPPPEIHGAPLDPVPGPVRGGPRVHLPNRDYLLYQGAARDALALARLDGAWGQCPNIWWPADRAWCVASEIDLQWTYVGGPGGLIDAILADDRIEALPAAPGDPVSRVEEWVTAWADQLADGLLARGKASIRTPRGSVSAWLRRPGSIRAGRLRIEVAADDGSGTSTSDCPGLRGSDEALRRELHLRLTLAVLELTAM